MQLNDCSGGPARETELDASTTCHVPSVGKGRARVHDLGAMARPGRKAFGGLIACRSEIWRAGEWAPSSASVPRKARYGGQG